MVNVLVDMITGMIPYLPTGELMVGKDIVIIVLSAIIIGLVAIHGVILYWLVSSHIWPTLVKVWSRQYVKETE